MTFTPEISSVNQRPQFGAESTPGTAVPAGKLLPNLDLVPTINGQTTPYSPSGYKYPTSHTQDWEETSLTVNGPLDFNSLVYLASSAGGVTSPSLNGSSATAYKWLTTPPVTGSVQPQTYSVQMGDSIRARSFNRMMLSAFGYKWTPKTRPMLNGCTMFGLPLTDAITLTSSPSAIAEAPMADAQFFFYLDLTSGGIGTTGLTRLFSVDYAFTNIAAAFYASNRSSIGLSGHVDLVPKTSIKLLLMADATGLAAMQSYYRSSQTLYFRTKAVGALIDNLQIATITGGPTGGTFTLTYKGQTTTGIAYNAAASAVQSALVALSTIGSGNVTVSGSNGGPYSIVFPQSGTLGQDTTALTASGAGLTGGSSPGVTITQAQSSNTFQHDLAVQAAKPNAFADNQGIYAIEWELTCVADLAWNGGQAQQFTVINLLSGL